MLSIIRNKPFPEMANDLLIVVDSRVTKWQFVEQLQNAFSLIFDSRNGEKCLQKFCMKTWLQFLPPTKEFRSGTVLEC